MFILTWNIKYFTLVIKFKIILKSIVYILKKKYLKCYFYVKFYKFYKIFVINIYIK